MTGGAGHVALRVMTRADIPDGLRLSGAAGWNQRESDWRFLLEGNPGRFVVAVRDGRVIGSGGAVCYGTSLAWVCMILVDPSERGHGIGTRIVSGVLESLSDMRSVGLDATPFGLGVYTRLGFVETSRLLRMEAPPTSGEEDESPVRPLAPSDFSSVLALDREVFGADRGEVLRAAAARAGFRRRPRWRHRRVLFRAGRRALAADRSCGRVRSRDRLQSRRDFPGQRSRTARRRGRACRSRRLARAAPRVRLRGEAAARAHVPGRAAGGTPGAPVGDLRARVRIGATRSTRSH